MATSEIALRDDQDAFTPKQVAALKQLGVDGAQPADLALFFHQCARTGLDPFARQIYMIGRNTKEGDRWVVKQTIQTGIDGFRLIASRADAARSLSPVEWLRKDGQWMGAWSMEWGYPIAARVSLTKGNGATFHAVANFDEYKQTTKGNELTNMWRSKPALMIAKCAEALLLRMAYPQDLSGLYTEDELDTEVATTVRVVEAPEAITPVRATITRPAVEPATAATTAAASPISDKPAPPRPTRATITQQAEPAPQAALGPVQDELSINEPKPEDHSIVDAVLVEEAEPAPVPPPSPSQEPHDEQPRDVKLISPAQMKKLNAALTQTLGAGDRDKVHAFCEWVTGHPLATSKELTMREAMRVIDTLENEEWQQCPVFYPNTGLPDAKPNPDGLRQITDEQVQQLHQLADTNGIPWPKGLCQYAEEVLSASVASVRILTRDEADEIIHTLEATQ